MAAVVYHIGQLVRHPTLGVGKVLAVQGDSVRVFFKDQTDNPRTIAVTVVKMDIPKNQSDPWLDNLDISVAETGIAKHYLTQDQAVKKFLHYFPKGFYDPHYIGTATRGERAYKIIAHELWGDKLNRPAFQRLLKKEDYIEIAHRALQVEGKMNLLATFEKAALHEAVGNSADAKTFALGLFDLIYGEREFQHRFTGFADTLGRLPQRGTPLRWTVQTIFPFIALPKEHLFLKPEVTKQAAERRAFSLNYKPEPNWLTYSCLLKLGEILMTDLAKLKPRDMIDIQSFIFVTGDSNYG